MKRHTQRRGDAGFTLLDMLLALALLSLLTGALVGGLNFGRRAFETSRANQAVGDLEAAATAVSNLLAHAYPLEILNAGNTAKPTFLGREDGCYFVGLSDGEAQKGGLLATDIVLEPGDNGLDLAVRSAVFRAQAFDSISREGMRKTEAARNVAYLKFSYFGEIEDGKPPRWSEYWTGTSRLPLLVSVRLGAVRFGRKIDMSFNVELRQRRP